MIVNQMEWERLRARVAAVESVTADLLSSAFPTVEDLDAVVDIQWPPDVPGELSPFAASYAEALNDLLQAARGRILARSILRIVE